MTSFRANFDYRLLRRIASRAPSARCAAPEAMARTRTLTSLLDGTALDGKVVIDFGCGEGADALEIARRGARRVIGIDIREKILDLARQKAVVAGLDDRCEFTTTTRVKADLITSIDAFEHFENPAEILDIMYELLAPGGAVLISFGPTWFHPYGGHLFSVFPWAHLVFSEEGLLRWRSHFRNDGATRFNQVEGGLNQMTISRFRKLIENSRFIAEKVQAVPIRRLRFAHGPLTQEFFSSVVRCTLRKPIATEPRPESPRRP
jgi:SAM-dependent methyltransferase